MKGLVLLCCATYLVMASALLPPSVTTLVSYPLSVSSSPRLWAWDVHACPLGFRQVDTGTGCRRRRPPSAHLGRGGAGYGRLQTTPPVDSASIHKVCTLSTEGRWCDVRSMSIGLVVSQAGLVDDDSVYLSLVSR
jgi:hypothetical protein